MSTTHQKIIDGAIQQIGELSWSRASTKLIAAAAGVNELTLFRLFGSKRGLLEAVLAETIGPVNRQLTALQPVDLETDLSSLAAIYVRFVGSHPKFVMHILAETYNPDISDLIMPMQQQLFASLRIIFKHYRPQLTAAVPIDDIALAFMGPLLARSFFQHLDLSAVTTADVYVQSFLRGYQKI